MTADRVPAPTRCGPAVVLVAHGAERSRTAGASLRYLVEDLRRRSELAAVELAFVHGEPSLAGVLDRLGAATDLCVVPMFAAEGHHTRGIIGTAVDAARRAWPARTIRQSVALGINPAYTRSLAQRLRALVAGAGLATVDAAFLAIGHGSRRATSTPDDAASRLAAALRPDFATSEALYLDGEPSAATWPQRVDRAELVVAPVFFSDATHAGVDVPQLFARPAAMPALADEIDGPWTHRGRRIWSVALPPASADVADIVIDLACGERRTVGTPPARAAAAIGRNG